MHGEVGAGEGLLREGLTPKLIQGGGVGQHKREETPGRKTAEGQERMASGEGGRRAAGEVWLSN